MQGFLNAALGLSPPPPICTGNLCVQTLMHRQGRRMHLQRELQVNEMPRWEKHAQ